MKLLINLLIFAVVCIVKTFQKCAGSTPAERFVEHDVTGNVYLERCREKDSSQYYESKKIRWENCVYQEKVSQKHLWECCCPLTFVEKRRRLKHRKH